MSTDAKNAEKMRIANDMLQAWSELDFERALALFSEDAVLDSMVGEPMIGRDVIRERTEYIVENLSLMEMNVIRMGVVDDRVMMERLDKYIIHGRHGTIPIVGVMQIEGGKVIEWREYFDRANWLQNLDAESNGQD